MNLGLYLDLRNPPEWRVDPARLYAFTLELCEEAERLGAHSVWLSEHHRFDDGYLPQPLTFAAAVAARTSRMRIGTAVVVAPLRHPAHIAEEAAVVDLLSDGRLELGLGAGYQPPEYDLFDADFTHRYSATDHCVRGVRRIWAAGAVTPVPRQPRVPIWLGYQGPQGARRAGLLGEGLLSVHRELLEPYRAGLREGGHDDSAARMAGVVPVFVTDDPEADWPLVARHHAYQWDSYRRYGADGTDRPAPRPVDPERSRERGLTPGMGNLLYATPEEAAPQLRAYVADLPVETVYVWASLAGMPEDVVLRHVQLLCTRLAPLLQG